MAKTKLTGYAKPKLKGSFKKRRLVVACSLLVLVLAASGTAKIVTGSWLGAKAAVTLNHNPFYSKCDPVPSKRPILKEGARDNDKSKCVTALQRALNDCCAQGIPEDGYFGPSTKQAVLNFQNFFNTATKDGIVNADIWGGVDYMMSIAVTNAGLVWIEPQQVWDKANPKPVKTSNSTAKTSAPAPKTTTPSAATGRSDKTAAQANKSETETNHKKSSTPSNPAAAAPSKEDNHKSSTTPSNPAVAVPTSPTPTKIGTPLSSGTVVRAVTIAPTKEVVTTHTKSSTPSNPAAAPSTSTTSQTKQPETQTHSPPTRQNTPQSAIPSNLKTTQPSTNEAIRPLPTSASSNSNTGCPAGKVKKFTATNKFVCLTPSTGTNKAT